MPRAPARDKSQRLEGAFGLRKVDKILRDAFFLEDARDHFLVAALAAQSGFDDGAAARGLEEVQKG